MVSCAKSIAQCMTRVCAASVSLMILTFGLVLPAEAVGPAFTATILNSVGAPSSSTGNYLTKSQSKTVEINGGAPAANAVINVTIDSGASYTSIDATSKTADANGKANFIVTGVTLGTTSYTFGVAGGSPTSVTQTFETVGTIWPSNGAITVSVTPGASTTISFTSPENPFPDGTVITADISQTSMVAFSSSASSGAATSTAVTSGGSASFTFWGGSTPSSSPPPSVKISAPHYMPMTMIGANRLSSSYMTDCVGATPAVTPCVKSASWNGSPVAVTATSPLWVLASQTSGGVVYPVIQYSGATSAGVVMDVEVNMGSSPTTSGYFGLVLGRPSVLTTTTVGGYQIIHVVMTSESVSSMTIRGGREEGNACAGQAGDCPAGTVARKDAFYAAATMFPVGVPVFNGGGQIPSAFAGGYTAQNANAFSLSNFSGKLSFTYTGPHFKANGTTLNTGFYDTVIPSQALSDVFNLPGANAAEISSLISVLDAEVGGSTSTRTSGITVTDVVGGVKVSLDPITFSSHNVEITTGARVVQPSTSTGTSSGSGSSSSGTTPGPVVNSPTTLIAPVAQLPSTATGVAPLRNPAVATPLTSNVILVSESEANSAPVRSMANPPAASITRAPVVNSPVGRIVSLTTQGLDAGTNYSVKLKINGKYVDLGSARTDATGMVSLPAFKPSAAGTYTIAIVNPSTGKTGYVKVKVPPKRR